MGLKERDVDLRSRCRELELAGGVYVVGLRLPDDVLLEINAAAVRRRVVARQRLSIAV